MPKRITNQQLVARLVELTERDIIEIAESFGPCQAAIDLMRALRTIASVPESPAARMSDAELIVASRETDNAADWLEIMSESDRRGLLE